MDKTLCLKFLEHLHRYSGKILQKESILPADIGYLNIEIETFRKRLDPATAQGFDAAAILSVVERLDDEGAARQAADVSKFVLKAVLHRYVPLLALFGAGRRDEGHERRYAKTAEFRDRIKKLVFVVDMAQAAQPAPPG